MTNVIMLSAERPLDNVQKRWVAKHEPLFSVLKAMVGKVPEPDARLGPKGDPQFQWVVANAGSVVLYQDHGVVLIESLIRGHFIQRGYPDTDYVVDEVKRLLAAG